MISNLCANLAAGAAYSKGVEMISHILKFSPHKIKYREYKKQELSRSALKLHIQLFYKAKLNITCP